MMRYFITTVAFLFSLQAFSQTKVVLIPTLHAMHASNPRYNYDSIQTLINRLDPDVVAVEIRSEDINTDTVYLKANYPFEMRMVQQWFPGKRVEGFDWLGADLEGRKVPARYWKDSSRIKALEQLMAMDSAMQKKLARCRIYSDARLNVLRSASLKQIISGSDAMLTQEYYNCLELTLRGSEYEELTAFYDLRNHKIQENVLNIISRFPGKTILVLTGADHYSYLRSFLQKQSVRLMQPF